jgi:hypothetical protein
MLWRLPTQVNEIREANHLPEESPFHSLAPTKAKKKREHAHTPGYITDHMVQGSRGG